MCKALDFAKDINNKIGEAKEYYNNLIIKEKVYEDMKQDILHKLENRKNMNMYEGWLFAKALQEIQINRRKDKQEKFNMELFLKEIGEFSVKTKNIKKSEKIQKEGGDGSKYVVRHLNIDKEPLTIVEDAIENMNSKRKISRASAIKPMIEEEKFYYISSKVPRTKGISIKMKYRNDKERLHIISKIALGFRECKVNSAEQYVDLIERK